MIVMRYSHYFQDIVDYHTAYIHLINRYLNSRPTNYLTDVNFIITIRIVNIITEMPSNFIYSIDFIEIIVFINIFTTDVAIAITIVRGVVIAIIID